MQTRRTATPLLREAGERGQTMVEYSIVAALIAVVAMVAVQALGVGVTGVFNDIVSAITTI
jgi:Flp pilus assembly pilin Flp